MKRLLRVGMEKLGLRKSLREDSPGEKATKCQTHEVLSVNVKENAQCVDEVIQSKYPSGEKAKNSQIDEVSMTGREDSRCVDQDTQSEDSHFEIEMDTQGVDVNMNVWEEYYQWEGEVGEDSAEVSQRTDGVSGTSNVCKDVQDEKIDPRRGDLMETLPHELADNILARLPFPFVFKARVLSKSWLARLSPISSQDDLAIKHHAISFQKQITELSVNWKAFFPVVYKKICMRTRKRILLYGFDRTSQTWLRLPSLPLYPPYHCYPELCRHQCNHCWPELYTSTKVEQIEGSLLLLSTAPFMDHRNRPWTHLYVANILTRSCKKLPCRLYGASLGKAHLCHLVDKYKVIHIPNDYLYICSLLEIYDSTSGAWTVIKIDMPPEPYRWLYADVNMPVVSSLDGVLYFVNYGPVIFSQDVQGLQVLALNLNTVTPIQKFTVVAEVTHTVMKRLWAQKFRSLAVKDVQMVICKVNLLMVILYTSYEEIIVLKIDLHSQRLTVCAEFCYMRGLVPTPPVHSDGDFVFTYMKLDSACNRTVGIVNDVDSFDDRMLAYDLDKDRWDLLPFNTRTNLNALPNEPSYPLQRVSSGLLRVSSSFRPGLNPFVAV